jgi:hypothetical protein
LQFYEHAVPLSFFKRAFKLAIPDLAIYEHAVPLSFFKRDRKVGERRSRSSIFTRAVPLSFLRVRLMVGEFAAVRAGSGSVLCECHV